MWLLELFPKLEVFKIERTPHQGPFSADQRLLYIALPAYPSFEGIDTSNAIASGIDRNLEANVQITSVARKTRPEAIAKESKNSNG